jgi:predicted phage terminase large subunit-like protein
MRLKWDAPGGKARIKQITPPGEWRYWLILAGRGWGKTDCGAHDSASYGLFRPDSRISVIAPTARDLRLVCFEGASGLLNTIPPECFKGGSVSSGYNRTMGELWLANGTKFEGFTGEEPGRLRGPQFHRAWCDEIAAWQYPQQTWDMLQFGLRLGDNPQCVITTTPKPIQLLRTLIDDSRTHLTTGSTYENEANLAKQFIEDLKAYEGTELGRQEIYAEILDPSNHGILKATWWRKWSKNSSPGLSLILQSWDTAFSEKTSADYSACTTWGVFHPEEGGPACILLIDAWRGQVSFPDLLEKAVELKKEYQPDVVLIEEKGSGLSLMQTLRRAGVSCIGYRPDRDKVSRAHAVASLLHSGRIYAPWDETKGTWRKLAGAVIDECSMFRADMGADEHDDFVDTCTQAWLMFRDGGLVKHPSQIEPEPVEMITRKKAAYG